MTSTEGAGERQPLDTWTVEVADEMARAQFAGGWLRALPATGATILTGATIRQEPVSLREIGSVLPIDATDDPWNAPCWYEDEAENAPKMADLDRYAAHYGLGPIRTCRELLTLLVTAGVLYESDDRVGPMYPLPSVDDVFPVTDKERATIADLRTMSQR